MSLLGVKVVAPVACVVPLPFAAVFHPANVKPVLTRDPEFVAVVIGENALTTCPAGTVPEELPFPL